MSKNPVVIIPGIGQSELIAEDGNGNKIKRAWPVEIDENTLMSELKGDLLKMMLFRKDGGFSDKVANIVNDVTDVMAINPDGTKKYDIKPVSVENSLAECTDDEKKYILKNVPIQNLADEIGEERVFFFAYDFFGDIEDTAKSLDAFITSVKTKTGSDKVDLFVYSIGGAILKAYLKEYSVKCDCEKVINFASALDGASIVADIYENKMNFTDAMSRLSSFGDSASSVSSMAGILPEDVISNVINKSLAVIKKNIFDCCTTLWSLIPDSRFDDVFAYCNPSSALAEKINAQHNYSKRFKDEVVALSQKGMKFYQICGSGQKLPQVFESYDNCSDGIVDTSSESLGEIFPDTTWYFDGLNHLKAMTNDVAMLLAGKILADEDINNYPKRTDVNA